MSIIDGKEMHRYISVHISLFHSNLDTPRSSQTSHLSSAKNTVTKTTCRFYFLSKDGEQTEKRVEIRGYPINICTFIPRKQGC